MKEKVLLLLKETGGYVSGQEICEKLGVSRTAVWKAIQSLQEQGYVITAVRNRGYRLEQEPDRISQDQLEAVLDTEWAGRNAVFCESVDSTNNRAKELADAGAPNGTLVFSEVQTAGRGRLGRSWNSPKGSGIWMSLLIRPDIPPVHASMVTLVAAIAVQRAIQSVSGLACGIKWPNDIVAESRKICGILTEMSAETDRINYIVIGIGINVLEQAFPEEIRETAASICGLTGKPVSRTDLIASVLREFERLWPEFLRTEDLSLLKEEYNRNLVNCGREVRVLHPRQEYTGIAEGINDQGELLVRTAGGLKTVYSGEVSVRGIYGYV